MGIRSEVLFYTSCILLSVCFNVYATSLSRLDSQAKLAIHQQDKQRTVIYRWVKRDQRSQAPKTALNGAFDASLARAIQAPNNEAVQQLLEPPNKPQVVPASPVLPFDAPNEPQTDLPTDPQPSSDKQAEQTDEPSSAQQTESAQGETRSDTAEEDEPERTTSADNEEVESEEQPNSRDEDSTDAKGSSQELAPTSNSNQQQVAQSGTEYASGPLTTDVDPVSMLEPTETPTPSSADQSTSQFQRPILQSTARSSKEMDIPSSLVEQQLAAERPEHDAGKLDKINQQSEPIKVAADNHNNSVEAEVTPVIKNVASEVNGAESEPRPDEASADTHNKGAQAAVEVDKDSDEVVPAIESKPELSEVSADLPNKSAEAPVEIIKNANGIVPSTESKPKLSVAPAIPQNKSTQAATNSIRNESSGASQPTSTELSYDLDESNCSQIFSMLPRQIFNMTIVRILNTISSESCSQRLDLKLEPASNKLIKGHVMEVSSMPIELAQLTGSPSRAHKTVIKCGKAEKIVGSKNDTKVRFNLTVVQNLPDQRLAAHWRKYPRLNQDDIPLEVFGSVRGARPRVGSKCQKFRVESGNFYINLLNFRTTIPIEVELAQLTERAFSSKKHVGGKIRLTDFKVDELYLDHQIRLGEHMAQRSRPTVQILHDNNNHYRRNNWLLDLYANWLKHEYRSQLSRMLAQPLASAINSCFSN